MSALFTDALLSEAYTWLCRQRREYPHNADIWHLRFRWESLMPEFIATLEASRWQLSPLTLVQKANGDTIALWSAADALALKCLTLLLVPLLPVHPLCEHIQGHGGGKQSVTRVHQTLLQDGWTFVCRTDIKGYYANISKTKLYDQLLEHVTDARLTGLLYQFINYSVENGGTFHTPKKGICRASSLSPLLAAFHLTTMDTSFASLLTIRYARYMDDFIIFTRTRWHLRRAVRRLNAWFAGCGFRQHPNKTLLAL